MNVPPGVLGGGASEEASRWTGGGGDEATAQVLPGYQGRCAGQRCGNAGHARQPARRTSVARPAGAGRAAASSGTAAPGTNLLLNPGAQTGAASRNGWDAVTIPGWQVISGLPTTVR